MKFFLRSRYQNYLEKRVIYRFRAVKRGLQKRTFKINLYRGEPRNIRKYVTKTLLTKILFYLRKGYFYLLLA